MRRSELQLLVTQPIDDLVNLPHIDVQLDIESFVTKICKFIRRKWFKSKKLFRVPGFLRTQYTIAHIILFTQGSATSVYTDHRVITISPNNDPKETIFSDNRIVSKRYTLWNFIPKNLFEQFRRIANFYFLVMAITSLMIESPISPLTNILPLSFVILVTACKQGYEDYLRYKVDQRVNRAFVTVIRNKCIQNIHCSQIVVGDLVKVYREQDIPCDLLLLSTTEDSQRCYVTTSNLDGETNLKTIMVPKVVSKMSTAQIVSMKATVTCQHPSSDLYTFHGKLELNNSNNESTTCHLTIQNLLLRGSKLKDTDHIIGCAIYTGHDTKLSLNSKITSNKFSTAEKSINRHIIIFIILLLAEVIVSSTMKVIMDNTMLWSSYLGPDDPISFSVLLTNFLSFIVLYNYIVPISLYVTIELQKFLSSFFFSWDIDMYDEATDQPALANTSDLNEELGQIEYLFADKTGTLTENLMVFRRCSINGKTYMEKDCDGRLYLLPPSGNEEEAVLVTNWEPEIWHFLISLALCHSVQISPPSQRLSVVAKRKEFRRSFKEKKVLQVNSSLLMDPDLPEYQAASADEKALVEASARCGVIFSKSNSDMIELKIDGDTVVYEKLEVLEFTSERKRMSVVVKDTAGDFWLYCKGADSNIFPLVVSGTINQAIAHVAEFSMRGLRTLVVGYRKMNEREYSRLIQKIEEARQIIGIERLIYMEKAYNLMESGLTLLGVTAVEDRLQEGVEETLESLHIAGIKIWVLTGDKAETAENIAFLCGQYKSGTEVLRVLELTVENVCFQSLTTIERRIKLEPHKQYGLLVDGSSIATALQNHADLFRSVATSCDTVVCCRLTPLQKSQIVSLMKKANTKPHTAAIGDGGNDVAMIQEAHVGIGIMGKEGRQAMMSSDFAIAKFRFLKKVLLVHGHWYYVRISILTQYFFYKNFIFITPQLFFNMLCGYSTQINPLATADFSNVTHMGESCADVQLLVVKFLKLYSQALYDALFLMLFNVMFTSTPILAYGLFEQDYTADKLLRYPHLYKLYQRNYLLSRRQFFVWTALACWHAITIYFMSHVYIYVNPVVLYNNTPIEQWSFSTIVIHLVTLIANLQVLLRSSYWTLPFVLTVLLSELTFLVVTLIYSCVHRRYDGDMLRVFQKLISSLTFWLLTIIVVTVCLIPDYLIIYNNHSPARLMRKNEEARTNSRNTNNDNTQNTPPQSTSQRLFNMISWKQTFTPQKAE